MRRHLVPAFLDFDTRATVLAIDIGDDWNEDVKASHLMAREQLMVHLREEFGDVHFDQRVRDFIDVGAAPFSILSYHNHFFRQSRNAFVYGAYYPALTSACALGERIINHLLLDLREAYRATAEYKQVQRKKSFDDWRRPINTLFAWGVLDSAVANSFRELQKLRNRSLHFNHATYATVRGDALAALNHLRDIINQQFGAFGNLRWFIEGTMGAGFIKKEYEADPFVRTYYLPQCPLVGPLYAVEFAADGVLFFDRAIYDDRDISDRDFCEAFNGRDPNLVVSTNIPLADGIAVRKLTLR